MMKKFIPFISRKQGRKKQNLIFNSLSSSRKICLN